MSAISLQRLLKVLIWSVLIAGVLLVVWYVVSPKAVVAEPLVPPEEPATLVESAPLPTPTEVAGVVVYVTGAVLQPGLYALSPTERVGAAVAAAGGMTTNAAYDAVNMAEHLSDGQHIKIPFATEEGTSVAESDTTAQTIAINTATATELEQLPGIGASMAARIVAYRTQHGPFLTLADLDAVSGIGAALLERLQPVVRF